MKNYLSDFFHDPRKYLKYFYLESIKIAFNYIIVNKRFNLSEILDRIYLHHERKLQVEKELPRDPRVLMDNVRYFLDIKLKSFLGNINAKLTVPKTDSPVVSIILILFNKAEYTYQCLETIIANADLSYEIVIVDNDSSDSTSDLLEKVENITVIKNKENAGFLRASNQGASVAKGQWLLFLNNDTQVLPSLLSKLVNTATSVDGCGAVGGKLIFPNGTLQEAGSIIWKDGSCLGYGRGDDPDKPEYSYVKEVDYCSGACLLVGKELFMKVGMFDELYYPAYYEETDLCMKVRQAGYKVVFQPSAKLIHYEFGSSTSSDWAIDLQKANKRKFAEKWASELSNRKPVDPAYILSVRELTGNRKSILVLEDRIPDPTLGSGYPRIYNIINILADMDLRITLFPMASGERYEPYTHILQQKGVEVFYDKARFNYDLESFMEKRKGSFDYIWVSRPHNMKKSIDVIKRTCPKSELLYDAEALFSLREILQQELNGGTLDESEKENIIREETSLIGHADQVITVSEKERALIHKYTGAEKVHVIGHTSDIQPTPNSFSERKDILFVGGFLNSPSPNEDSMLYFVDQVFPLIREKIDARLWIVGSNKLNSIKSLASEHIVVTGRVESLFEYFNNCRVFVAPTRFAAGIPLKLLECMSFGLPAVATGLLADQLGLGEEALLVGKTAEEFAEKVVKCYTNETLWKQLREKSLTYVENQCSAEAYTSAIKNIFK